MKTCPICGNSYGDDLSFCLQDGTRLRGRTTLGINDSPTDVYRPETNQNTDISTAKTIVSEPNEISLRPKQFQMSAVNPANRTGCVVTIGQISVLVMLVFGLGLGGFYYIYQRDTELAYSSNTSRNSASKPLVNAYNTSSNSPTFGSNANNPVPSEPVMAESKTIDGGVVNGKAITLLQPPYPPAARAVRATGTVNVKVLIDEGGRVVSANAMNGHPLLRSAAVQAARAAKFNPTIIAGQAVKVSGVLTYEFAP